MTFKISNNSENYNHWEFQKRYLSQIDGIDNQIRCDLINALDILKTEFGNSFLKRCSYNHPIKQKVTNWAKWQILEVIQFANVLQFLKSSESNYEILIPKLLSERNSKIEGVPFVEIVHTYIKEHFSVWFLEEEETSRTPDIKIKNPENGDVFYLEVTTLDYSKERRGQRKDYDFFHREFHHVSPQSSFCGRQILPLLEEDLTEIKMIIADAKNKVKHNQQIVLYSDKRFNFIIAPTTYDDEFEKICAYENIRINDIDGLPLKFNFVNQIRHKIESKLTQLPPNSTGMIYINVSPIFFMVTDLLNAIPRIEASMSASKEITGIVIYSKIVDTRKDTLINFGEHIFARRILENYCYESLFVFNKSCQLTISEETIKKIFKTFFSYINYF